MTTSKKIFMPLALGAWLMVACSQTPEDPGSCSLTCSSAIIGSRGFTIQAMMEDVNFTCSQPGPFPDAVTLYFLVLGNSPSGRGDEMLQVPVRNISFEPNVIGGSSKTHEDLLGPEPDRRPTPGRFAGVWTRPSEWCSDSCGVITLEVVPQCPLLGKTQNMSVQLHSGSVFSEPLNITIENPE